MVFRALLDPRFEATTPEERERVYRYNICKMAERLHQLPEEIEAMDVAWFRDFVYFGNAEALARKVKKT